MSRKKRKDKHQPVKAVRSNEPISVREATKQYSWILFMFDAPVEVKRRLQTLGHIRDERTGEWYKFFVSLDKVIAPTYKSVKIEVDDELTVRIYFDIQWPLKEKDIGAYLRRLYERDIAVNVEKLRDSL